MSFAHRLFLGILALAPAVAALGGENVTEIRDAVVAVVDKTVITRRQVLDQAAPAIRDIPAGVSPDERDRLTAQALSSALRNMIDEKLIAAEGQRLSDVNEAFRERVDGRVAERIEEERRKAGGEADFREGIRKSGLSYDEYRDRIRREIIRDVVLFQFVLRDLSVSPEELRQRYQEEADRYREPARVKYRQIFIAAGQYPSREKAREMADELMRLIAKQHDFADLARRYSNGPHADDGGLWDFQNKGARPAPIDELLFSLPAGAAGGPIETDLGFTILRVEERLDGRLKPFEEAQSEIEKALLVERRTRRYAELIDRLQREHHVEVLL
jgi:parvulin-like peptidyl-prolyl isomerase